jgi:hydrophobic/amphiphilic exporter-1 (mainly G- bacteria), HAE1 family
VVFGGMLASTLLAIPFVPVFYVLLERMSERWKRRKAPPSPAADGERRAPGVHE